MIRLVRDYETRCRISVSDVGSRRYAADPSFEVLCVGWRLKNNAGWGPPKVAVVCPGAEGRAAIENRIRRTEVTVSTLADFYIDFHATHYVIAHNQAFEIATEDRAFPEIAAMRQHKYQSCTAARARRLSLPGSLEETCRVLNTPHQKSMDGHMAMLQCSQPRPAWVKTGKGRQWFDDADRLSAVATYCAQDIFCESELDDYLPELPEREAYYWRHVEQMNRRGVLLDLDLIDAMTEAVDSEQLETSSRINGFAGELALTNPTQILAFCQQRGIHLPNLRKETVAALLEEHHNGKYLDPNVVTVLEARRDVGGKSSVSKLPRMKMRVLEGRSCDFTIYHGAHTGRTTGDGINLLNLPRPYKKFDQDFVVRNLLARNYAAIRQNQGVSVSTAVSASLRGVIIPGLNRKLVVGDYKTIEPCFSFSLAQQWDAVEILKNKGDLYCEMASAIYDRTIDPEKDKIERQLGKVVILGCGYGMGLTKFLATIENDPQLANIHPAIKERAWESYRKRFYRIPQAWRGLETAARSAIKQPGTIYSYNGVDYFCNGWWLVCTLPSGRPFYYPNARLGTSAKGYEDAIYYEGWRRIDGRPAGWGEVYTWGGSLLENITQAGCRDILEDHFSIVDTITGWEGVLSVYDEIVVSVPRDVNGAFHLEQIMSNPPAWYPDMPISAEVYEASRYVKK